MRKNLWLIEVILVALIALAWSALHERWDRAEKREQALLRRSLPQMPAPVVPPLTGVGPVTAAAYNDVAQQFVFSRDRNPAVILDPPAPPPPPKPMPDLPLSYGVIAIGAQPTIMLAEKAGGQQKGYRAGEIVGPFRIAALSTQDITLVWEDKVIRKTIDEITDKSALRSPAPAPQQAAAPPPPKPAVNPTAPVKVAPGASTSERTKACVPGDTSPPGTVVDGFRKVVTPTPFGQSCRWEAVN